MKLFKDAKRMKKIGLLAVPLALSAYLFIPTGTASAHCDSEGGPVVSAAKKALETGNVNYVLPYVYKDGEGEVKAAFQKTVDARKAGPKVQEVVDRWFYETAVRVHREGEGASYTGLKPAGIDYGPALPAAEKALETGSDAELKRLILKTVESEIDKRFAEVKKLPTSVNNVDIMREHVEAELMFEKYIHQLYTDTTAKVSHGEGEKELGQEHGKTNSGTAEPAVAAHSHE